MAALPLFEREIESEVPRYENVQEDEDIELNPFVFMKEDEEKNPTKFLAVGTEYDPEYMKFLDANRFYMGHRFGLEERIIGNQPGQRQFLDIPIKVQNIHRIEYGTPQVMKTQSLENITGLLTLQDYIRYRIIDLASAINSKTILDRHIKISDFPNKAESALLLSNIKSYVVNNSWTFYSHDKTKYFHIFAPMIASHGKKYTFKFLRLTTRDSDFSIYPFIYSITLEHGLRQIPITTPEGDIIYFYINVGPRPLNIPFPKYISYYSPENMNNYSSRQVEIQPENPDDCIVVSMFMAGLITQPDQTRYHNLFRQISIFEKEISKTIRLEHSLSHGAIEFSNNIMTRRINSFYNRQNPSSPLRTLKLILLTYQRPIRQSQYKKLNLYGDEYEVFSKPGFYNVYNVDCTAPTRNEQYRLMKKALDKFGCNRENVLFPITVPGHQLILSYSNGKYLLRDPQVNKYYDDILSHPNNPNNPSKYSYIGLLCTDTSLEAKDFSAICPQMRSLYMYCKDTPIYKGDPFPLVRNTINKFIAYFNKRRARPVYEEVVGVKKIEDSFVFDLSIKNVKLSKVREELFMLNRESLGLMQYPNPDISFDYYNRMITALDKVDKNYSDFKGLKSIRRFVREYYSVNKEEIIKIYNSRVGFFVGFFPWDWDAYTELDVYNFLLSRPLFSAFLKELTSVAADGVTPLSNVIVSQNSQKANYHIAEYLVNGRLPILAFNEIYNYLNDVVIKVLSQYKNASILSIITLAENLNEFVKQEEDFADGLSNGLEFYSKEYTKRTLVEVKNKVRNRIAIIRTLLRQGQFLKNSDVKEFFKENKNLIPRDYKGRAQTYQDISDSVLEEIIFDLLVNQLNYSQQELESHLQSEKPIEERVKLLSKPPSFIPIPKTRITRRTYDYEPKLRTLEQTILQKRLTSLGKRKMPAVLEDIVDVVDDGEEVDVAVEFNEYIVGRAYIDVMIEIEQDRLMNDSLWTWAEKDELANELAAKMVPDEVDKNDAFDVLVAIVNIIRGLEKSIDEKYLGRR